MQSRRNCEALLIQKKSQVVSLPSRQTPAAGVQVPPVYHKTLMALARKSLSGKLFHLRLFPLARNSRRQRLGGTIGSSFEMLDCGKCSQGSSVPLNKPYIKILPCSKISVFRRKIKANQFDSFDDILSDLGLISSAV